MVIEERTVYVVDGKQFNTLQKAEEHEADVIGALCVDPLLAGTNFHPRDRLKVLENMLRHRAQIFRTLEQ